MEIEFIGLSKRAYNALMRNGLHTVEDVLELKPKQLLSKRGIGRELLTHIYGKIREADYEIPYIYQKRLEAISDNRLGQDD